MQWKCDDCGDPTPAGVLQCNTCRHIYQRLHISFDKSVWSDREILEVLAKRRPPEPYTKWTRSQSMRQDQLDQHGCGGGRRVIRKGFSI